MEAPSGLIGRSGEGGRRRSSRLAQQTEQTRELLDQLGPPVEHRTVAGDVTAIRWLVDPEGYSAWVNRQSPTSQEKAQETAMEQLHKMEEQCAEGLLERPRFIVVTLNNSGGRLPHERYDLLLLREWIQEGWLRQVVFRNEKRLARQEFTLAWVRQLMVGSGTELYFTSLRRAVDFTSSQDRVLFTVNGLFASEDRHSINEQTQIGLDRRYTDELKGWPGLQKIGLKRDPLSGYMIEDEFQTEMIVRGARMFASMGGIKSGIAQMAKRMTAEHGFELSPKQWERVFDEEGFTTGDFFFNRRGRGRVPLKHIDLINPIPPDLRQLIREARATNKGNSRSRPGDFVLLRAGDGQGLPAEERGVFCARCGAKLGAWLQGELNDTRYRHKSPVAPCCHMWGGVERSIIEPPVMRELWRLDTVLEFREAAVRAAAVDGVRMTAHLDEAQRKQLRREVEDIEREIARLGREYRKTYLHQGKAAKSKKDHIAAYAELTAGLREDKRHLETRIAEAEALEALELSLPPSVDRDLSVALREVLTEDVPEDDAACRRRAAVFGRLVTKVVIDKRDDGTFLVELYGPLIPRDLPVLSVPGPSEFVAAELAAHRDAQDGGGKARVVFGDARRDLDGAALQVSSQGAPSDETCNRRHAWLISLTANECSGVGLTHIDDLMIINMCAQSATP